MWKTLEKIVDRSVVFPLTFLKTAATALNLKIQRNVHWPDNYHICGHETNEKLTSAELFSFTSSNFPLSKYLSAL